MGACTHQEDVVMGICYNHQGTTITPATQDENGTILTPEKTEYFTQPETFIGLILGGAERTKINGLNMAQESNVVIGFCGHVGIIGTSSNIVKAEGLGVARQFDAVIGEGVIANIMSGSENIFVG
jgi:hypothetical protein